MIEPYFLLSAFMVGMLGGLFIGLTLRTPIKNEVILNMDDDLMGEIIDDYAARRGMVWMPKGVADMVKRGPRETKRGKP